MAVKTRVEELNLEGDVLFLNGSLVNVATGHNKEGVYKRGGRIVEGYPVGPKSDRVSTPKVSCICQ